MVPPKNSRGRPPAVPSPRNTDELAKYRTVKVPESVYQNALRLRADLVRGGVDAVPVRLSDPPRCPRCGGPVHKVMVGAEFVSCGAKDCGYQQQSIGVDANGKTAAVLGLGVLLGLGIAAVFNAMNEGEPRPMARVLAARKRAPKKRSKGVG